MKRGWFKQWEHVLTMHVLPEEQTGFPVLVIAPFHCSTIYEAHAFRNTVSTEALFHEYVARELDVIQRALNNAPRREQGLSQMVI